MMRHLILPVAAVIAGATVPCSAGATGDTIFDLGTQGKAQLALGDGWTQADGAIRYTGGEWTWSGSVTLDPGISDYQLDAVISLAQPNFGGNNGAGFVFRESDAGSALFYVWQPWGGWAAQGEVTGPDAHWSKDQTRGLGKDTESRDHHLRAIVKGDLANFFVDDKLVSILDLTGRPGGRVGIRARHNALFKSLTITPLAPGVRLARTRPVRNLLKNGRAYPGTVDWRTVVKQSIGYLDDAIKQGTAGVPGDEDMPAYTYRCMNSMKADITDFYAYPAFHHSLIIDSLLDYYEFGGERRYVAQALKLARWEMNHSTPATDKLPYLPYSTTMQGKMGGRGNQDGDAIMVDKAGTMGLSYLRLWKMTGDKALLDAAVRIGNTLLAIQLPEGRWQNRVENVTGKVFQDYTSNQVFNITLMDQLFEATRDQRYADSSKRALDWVIANPVKTYKWIGYYEDVESTVQSVGNWDAIETARYLIAHRDRDGRYLKMARDISGWIGTTFAVDQWGVWPLICEQSVCMPVMSCHTLHYACLLSDLYEATGENYYRQAATSAAHAGFDLARNNENWYSLTSAPLYLGLELAKDLGL